MDMAIIYHFKISGSKRKKNSTGNPIRGSTTTTAICMTQKYVFKFLTKISRLIIMMINKKIKIDKRKRERNEMIHTHRERETYLSQ